MYRGKRVLLVDDDENTRATMEETLLSSGFQVDSAEDSRRALQKIEKTRYDLAIVDLMLPDLDGVLLRGKIQRTDPALSDRLIFTTGFTDQPTVLEYLRQMGSAFLAKPFRPTDLLEAVRRSLAGTGALEEGAPVTTEGS